MGPAIFILLIAMASVQIGASFAKYLFPVIGSIGATTLRLFFATIILWVVWKPWKEKLTRAEGRTILLYGSALGLMNLTFYLALERIPLGITVALEFTGPLTLALYSSRKSVDFVWAILAILGIILILPLSQTSLALDPVGIFFALAAGACWASYIVFGKRASASGNSGKTAAWGMLAAMLVVLPFGLLHTGSRLLNVDVFPRAFLVAILSSAIPYSLEMFAMRKIPVKSFGILMSLEPAMAVISGVVFLQEYLLMAQWVAIGCIVIASFGSALTGEPSAS